MQALQEFRLQIAPEEVQQQPPWKYVGVKMLDQTIQPQTIQFSTKVQTLNVWTKTFRYHQLGMTLFRVNYPTFITLV